METQGMDAKRLDYFKEKLIQKQLSLRDMVQRTEGYGREKEPDIQDVADMAVDLDSARLLVLRAAHRRDHRARC